MHTQVICYEADGLSFQSRLYFVGQGTPRPGILVFPEALGLSEHTETCAQQLAELGYVALACDIHGDGKFHPPGESLRVVIQALRGEPSRMRARAAAALAALVSRAEVDSSRIAAIGYCFGGTLALELARGGADIAGAVGFHSGLSTVSPEDARNIKGKILVCIGADDPIIPLDQRVGFEKEMRAAGVDWQMNVFGGVAHSFTNKAFDSYNPKAAARSWAMMRTFLDEIFA